MSSSLTRSGNTRPIGQAEHGNLDLDDYREEQQQDVIEISPIDRRSCGDRSRRCGIGEIDTGISGSSYGGCRVVDDAN